MPTSFRWVATNSSAPSRRASSSARIWPDWQSSWASAQPFSAGVSLTRRHPNAAAPDPIRRGAARATSAGVRESGGHSLRQLPSRNEARRRAFGTAVSASMAERLHIFHRCTRVTLVHGGSFTSRPEPHRASRRYGAPHRDPRRDAAPRAARPCPHPFNQARPGARTGLRWLRADPNCDGRASRPPRFPCIRPACHEHIWPDATRRLERRRNGDHGAVRRPRLVPLRRLQGR
jgi:hypothetical protein